MSIRDSKFYKGFVSLFLLTSLLYGNALGYGQSEQLKDKTDPYGSENRKKYAVIICGSEEPRHNQNVKLANDFFGRNFEVHILYGDGVNDTGNFPVDGKADIKSIKQHFKEIGKKAKKQNSLIAIYTTGHGAHVTTKYVDEDEPFELYEVAPGKYIHVPYTKFERKESALVLNGGKYIKCNDFIKSMPSNDNTQQVYIGDQCLNIDFAEKANKKKHYSCIAITSKTKITQGNIFSRLLFHYGYDGTDINGDGKLSFTEFFSAGHYRDLMIKGVRGAQKPNDILRSYEPVLLRGKYDPDKIFLDQIPSSMYLGQELVSTANESNFPRSCLFSSYSSFT